MEEFDKNADLEVVQYEKEKLSCRGLNVAIGILHFMFIVGYFAVIIMLASRLSDIEDERLAISFPYLALIALMAVMQSVIAFIKAAVNNLICKSNYLEKRIEELEQKQKGE